jgi:competence protein ComEA
MKATDRSVVEPDRPVRRRSGAARAVRPSPGELLTAARWRAWRPIAMRAAALGVALLGLAGIGSVVGRAPSLSEPVVSRAGLELGALSTPALAVVGSAGAGSAGAGSRGAEPLARSTGGGMGSKAVGAEPSDERGSRPCSCPCAAGTTGAGLSAGAMATAQSTGSTPPASSPGSAVPHGLAVGGPPPRRQLLAPVQELPVVLNRADAAELRRLPGVGAKRAEAIVLLRQRLGRFRRPNELLRVKGIGPRTLERMLPHLVLD